MNPEDSFSQSQRDQYSGRVEAYSLGTREIFVADQYRQMLRDWVKLPIKKQTILDLGCGDGTFSNLLKEFTPDGEVIGVDLSLEMIEYARQLYPGVDFKVGDMDHLPLKDESIDFIFSRFTVHYSKDLRKTLNELSRITRPEGLFFLKEIHPLYATFFKKSLDYEQKEDVTFVTQGKMGIEVVHPTFTFEEYINGFQATGWRVKTLHEFYGRDASGDKIKPYRVPTSVCFILERE